MPNAVNRRLRILFWTGGRIISHSMLYCFLIGLMLSSAARMAQASMSEHVFTHPANAQHITLPQLPYNKKVYNIAYFEGGSYWEYQRIFVALQESLPQHKQAELLDFPAQYHFSPGWDLPEEAYTTIARSIMDNRDIDMVIAMGSVAAKALLRSNNGEKPVICLDVADPVFMGLVNGATYVPVATNFLVDHVPDKWMQSIRIMSMLHSFKRIGAISTGTPEGNSYTNIAELLAVGRERGFTVVTWEHLDQSESVESCQKGIEALIKQGIDGMYIPALPCFDPKEGNPELLYSILHDNNVKTYAKDGKVPVSKGALIGVSTLNYLALGSYYAHQLIRIASHDTDAPLPPLSFEPKIYLNTATARKLGIHFPNSLLINVDGIYDKNLPPLIQR